MRDSRGLKPPLRSSNEVAVSLLILQQNMLEVYDLSVVL